MARAASILKWAAVAVAVATPVAIAANSPYLAYRDPAYIIAGFAGVLGLALILIQPLLAAGYLPLPSLALSRRLHRWLGVTLVSLVVVHVGGLWLTSPPDVADALLFRSPTPFSLWGVLAMWTLFAAALAALFRRRLRISPTAWRRLHTALALATVLGVAAHAMLIEGTMGFASKTMLCAAVVLTTIAAIARLGAWRRWTKPVGRRN